MVVLKRGWLQYFVDRAVGWWSGLPWESCDYTVESVRIPIGDDINLAGNLYRPTIAKPHGTIVVRTPFGIEPMAALGHARMFAPRGYVVLLAACRGTDPTDGGELIPGINETTDGLATVLWLHQQPWYTGSFATYGGSYLGFTQWAILSNAPPDMKAAVVLTGPHDFGAVSWGTGALESHMIAWADLMTATKRGIVPSLSYIKRLPQTLRPVYDGTPLLDAVEEHLHDACPDWLRHLVTNSDLTSEPYPGMNQSAALTCCSVPILQLTGWRDAVLPMITQQHFDLVANGAKPSLIIGPWSHIGTQRGTRIADGFRFIEHHLASRGENPITSPAHVFVTGAKEWRSLSAWPPLTESMAKFYLWPDQVLSQEKPPEDATYVGFTFDPAAPTPDIGMARPFADVLPANYNDTALAARSDVVVFTTTPLAADLEICGRPIMELYHESDSTDVDILIRLSQVDGKGFSTRICEAYQRLDSQSQPRPLTLSLSDCAHRFEKGNCIRIIIAGGAHPAYIRNTGTHSGGKHMVPSKHTVHHSVGAPSMLRLPVTV